MKNDSFFHIFGLLTFCHLKEKNYFCAVKVGKIICLIMQSTNEK